MSRIEVFRKSDGTKVFEYLADDAIEFAGFEFATHDHIEAPSESSQVPETLSKITRLAFRGRFTQSEKVALYTAADSNKIIQVWLDDLAAATYVDLKRADTRASVEGLVAVGLLTAARASDILNIPPTEVELYHGE